MSAAVGRMDASTVVELATLTPIRVIVSKMPDNAIKGFIEAGKEMAFDPLFVLVAGRPVLFETQDGRLWIRLYEPRPDGSWRGGVTEDGFRTFDSKLEPLRVIAPYRWGERWGKG